MVNSVAKDEQDGDVDMKVRIFPNAKKKKVTVPYPLSDVKNWNSKSGKTFGHTFLTHGQKERKNLEGRLETGNGEQGCWLDNDAVAAYLETLKTTIDSMGIGEAQTFPLPSGLGIVIYKDTSTNEIIEYPAVEMKLIRGSSKARAFIKTAFPIK